MQTLPKLSQIANSIKLSKELWQEKIYQSWELGQSHGFAVGDSSDLPSTALVKEGYALIAEIEGMAIGTDWLTSIIAVTNSYGPWAVDITDNLLKSKYFMPQRLSLFNKIS